MSPGLRLSGVCEEHSAAGADAILAYFITPMYISDLKHFLDDKGAIGPQSGPARRIAEFLGNVVAAASAPDGLDIEGLGECRCNKCKGTVIIEIAPDDTIEWSCVHCAQEGRISNWRGSFWDLSDKPAKR